jgi:sortase (surface protein transpeptidase)
VTVSLVVGGVWWTQAEEPGGAADSARPGSPTASPTESRAGAPGVRTGGEVVAKGAEPGPQRSGSAPKGRGELRAQPPPRRARPATPNAPGATSGASRATRLTIPFLDVDAPVMSLRLDRERRLPAPPDDDPNLVGWYADGPSPGRQGTAVAVGHLDTDNGPAVFAGLVELQRGRLIEVTRADGRTAVYAVDAVKSYEKDRFPNREVYGARGRPELRLITCGGDYDRRTGYSGNLVVFAHLVETREPPGTSVRR